MQALDAAQNPRLTAKEIQVTATQNCDPKQTHASEGAMKFCANHRGRDNLKFQAQASALEPTSKRSMLKQPVRSAISWNRAIETSSKDHLWRELGDAERITAASIIVKGYKMHAEMNIE